MPRKNNYAPKCAKPKEMNKMMNKLMPAIFLFSFLLCGCATEQDVKSGAGSNFPKMQRVDIDDNGVKEIIQVEDDTVEGVPGFIVKITRPDKKKDYPISIEGIFIKIELVDLGLEGEKNKHIAVFYRNDLDESDNLVIYRLSNDRLIRIFATSSICGIDMDFSTVLARVKIDKPICVEDNCHCAGQPNWENWVWTGKQFIRELR